MRKKFILMIFIIVISIVGYSINISVSIYPYYLMLKDIVDEKDSINIIVPAGKSPHTYALSSKDLINVYKSDLVIFNGLNSEIFISKIISNLKKKNIPFIYASDFIPKNELIGSESKEYHENYNPHIWLNPYFAYNYIIPGILENLIEVNPEKKDVYKNNAEILINKLKFLDAYLLLKANEINGSIITFHNSFPYFAKRYNIVIAGVIENSPGIEPSIAEMKRLTDLAKSKKVKALFSEPQLNKKLAEKLAKTLKIKLSELDPLGNNYNTLDEFYLMNFLNILNATR